MFKEIMNAYLLILIGILIVLFVLMIGFVLGYSLMEFGAERIKERKENESEEKKSGKNTQPPEAQDEV